MNQKTEKKSKWLAIKCFCARLAPRLHKATEKHWIVSWAFVALSGVWYSLILTFFGEKWDLIERTPKGNATLSTIGWIVTLFLVFATSAIKLADKYHSSHNPLREALEEQTVAGDLFFGICNGKAKVNSCQETSYIARIEELTNRADAASTVSYNPCAQIERITEELRNSISKAISDRGTRFDNDLYIGVAYNLPLHNPDKWSWCKNTCERGLCIDMVMSENSSFYQLIRSGRHEMRVFYNSKEQAAKDKLYVPDNEDVHDPKTGAILGSIACYSIELKKNDVTYIRIAIGISSYRNMFISNDKLPCGWKNGDLNNCAFIQNLDYIVQQYAALLRIELCKFYINKLQLNLEKNAEEGHIISDKDLTQPELSV